MDRAYIEPTLPNIVSVTIMAIVGAMALALVLKLGQKYVPGVSA